MTPRGSNKKLVNLRSAPDTAESDSADVLVHGTIEENKQTVESESKTLQVSGFS